MFSLSNAEKPLSLMALVASEARISIRTFNIILIHICELGSFFIVVIKVLIRSLFRTQSNIYAFLRK